MSVFELLLKIVVSFLVLLCLARLMGRKEISQMTFFNFVSAMTIGSIAADTIMNQQTHLHIGMIALIAWALFTILMGYLDIKSKKVRKVVNGQPITVIKNGVLLEKSLRKTRLTIDSLQSLLREKNIFSINDVDQAIFETSGKLSVLQKHSKQQLSKTKDSPEPVEVISSGKINVTNLAKLNLDIPWLDRQIQEIGIATISEITHAEVEPKGSLYIQIRNKPKNERKHS
ncbi:DUF421 domain-containing protein [Virgibacillus salexigens]|uniref:DUF421 domain-containing protein n=1 Tax=Virgibacillus massiliensis TaxID=1462526 RepID=UPI0013719C01|nr:DUF421 domain-containing protein [Virgibacillus massiliensis]MYL43102.1 DUF421 domain-containing protein [Virgibacillus massiliensis]